MVNPSKTQVRQLKTALRWKIPAAAQRIQMVLLRECGMAQPADCSGHGCLAEHGEPRAHGLSATADGAQAEAERRTPAPRRTWR